MVEISEERCKKFFIVLSIVLFFASAFLTTVFVQDNYTGEDAEQGEEDFINECWISSSCPLVPPGSSNLDGVNSQNASDSTPDWDKISESINVNDKETHIVITVQSDLPGEIIVVRDTEVTYKFDAEARAGASIPVRENKPMTIYYEEGGVQVELYPQNTVDEQSK